MNRLQNKNMAGPVCFRVSGKRTERPSPRWFAGVQGRSPCPSALASGSERPWPARNERQSRHSPGSVVRKVRAIQGLKRMIAWFCVGWLMMLAVQITMRLLIG